MTRKKTTPRTTAAPPTQPSTRPPSRSSSEAGVRAGSGGRGGGAAGGGVGGAAGCRRGAAGCGSPAACSSCSMRASACLINVSRVARRSSLDPCMARVYERRRRFVRSSGGGGLQLLDRDPRALRRDGRAGDRAPCLVLGLAGGGPRRIPRRARGWVPVDPGAGDRGADDRGRGALPPRGVLRRPAAG